MIELNHKNIESISAGRCTCLTLYKHPDRAGTPVFEHFPLLNVKKRCKQVCCNKTPNPKIIHIAYSWDSIKSDYEACPQYAKDK